MISIMKNKLEILEKRFKTRQAVADRLGISLRHYRRIKKDGRVSKPVGLLIEAILAAKR